MNKDVAYILAMSAVLPAIVGAVRYKKMDQRYHPFIFMLLLVPVVETIQYISLKTGMYIGFSLLCLNLYLLTSFCFFLSLVYRNGYIGRKMGIYFAGALLVTALVNLAIVGTPFVILYYMLCLASCLILLISIDTLSKQMMAVKTSLVKNCWFWISSLYVVQHAYVLLLFGIYIFGLSASNPNIKAIFIIHKVVNASCYILFIIAVLRIPNRKETSVYQISQTSLT
jgi:hypothetical protein